MNVLAEMEKNMKFIFLIMVGLLSVKYVLACQPPPDRLSVQASELGMVVSSPELFAKIRTLGGSAIMTINDRGRAYEVVASNGCTFTIVPVWEGSPYPGMCPSLTRLNIGEGICP